MHRRHFLQLSSLVVANSAAIRRLAAAQPQMAMGPAPTAPAATSGSADITLNIAPVTVELAPDRILSTMGYNGASPGPVLRMKEGKPVTVEVVNDTDTPELVHWHGLTIPADVDGTDESGTPVVPARGRFRVVAPRIVAPRIVALGHGGRQPGPRAVEPLLAHRGQPLAALPQLERLLQAQAAGLEPLDHRGQLVPGLLVGQGLAGGRAIGLAHGANPIRRRAR